MDRCTGAINVQSHPTGKRKTLQTRENLLGVINRLKMHGHVVKRIISDNEGIFLSDSEYFIANGIEMTNSAAYRHVSVVERGIRVVKERFRATLLDLCYKLPKRLYGHLLSSVCESINMVSDTHIKSTISPIQRITGERISYKLALRVGFGQYIQVHNPNHNNVSKGEIISRTQAGIVVGRNYKNGSVTLWTVPDGNYVNRDVVYEASITDLVIAAINEKAREDDTHFSTIPAVTPMKFITEGNMPVDNDYADSDEFGENPDEVEENINGDDEAQEADTIPPIEQPENGLLRRNPTREARREWVGDDNNAFPPEMNDENYGQREEQGNYIKHSSKLLSGDQMYMKYEQANHLSVKNAEKMDLKATKKAIVKEITSLNSQGTFEYVHVKDLTSKDRRSIIPSVLFMKSKGEGLMKARLVGGGHRQEPKPYQETTSPTVSTDSVLSCIAIATERNMEMSTGDVETAYLKADNYDNQLMRIGPKETIYFIEAYPELRKYVDNKGTLIVRIKKALYGLLQSARLWYLHLSASLMKLGYTPTLEDKCVFKKNIKGKLSFILVHVDDLLMMTDTVEEQRYLWKMLEVYYPNMKLKGGDNLSYLGMEIHRNREKKTIRVTLEAYTRQLLKDHPVVGTKRTPANKNIMDAYELKPIDITAYTSLLMKLMYVAKKTRPDILFACVSLACHSKEPSEKHWKDLEHVLKYLQGTVAEGITFEGCELRLYCYADASYAIHDDAKSHTGMNISIGKSNSSFMNFSKKQKIVSTSSTESELIAMHQGLKSVIGMQKFLTSLGIKMKPPVLFQDNTSTISLAEGGRPLSSATKHIKVRYFSIKEYVENGEIVIDHLSTELMTADTHTKPLVGSLFLTHKNRLMGMRSNVTK